MWTRALLVVRLVAQKLSEAWGRRQVIDRRLANRGLDWHTFRQSSILIYWQKVWQVMRQS
jgi:hypothetical protein